MKTLGIILILLGVAGGVYFGIQALNNSETFSFLGFDVAVSNANWAPVIFCGIATVAGFIILALRGKK